MEKNHMNIKLIILDVDGVLTDGKMHYTNKGDEMKSYNALDGKGIEIWRRSKREIAIITGEKIKCISDRAKKLKIKDIYLGITDKEKILEKMKRKYKISNKQIAFVGDDLNDFKIMKQVGLPIAVNNAVPEIKKISKYVTKTRGGEGAVREAVEFILKKEKVWQKAIKYYTG